MLTSERQSLEVNHSQKLDTICSPVWKFRSSIAHFSAYVLFDV